MRAIKRLCEVTGKDEDDALDYLLDALPHGSGIDCTWDVEVLKNGNVVFRNSYHGMDEGGYYDGWQDFSVVIFCHQRDVLNPLRDGVTTQVLYRKGDLDFRLEFNGGTTRKSWAYGLKDYLYETIGYALSEAGIGKMRSEFVPSV